MLTLSALSIRVSLLWNILHIRIKTKASVTLTAMLRTNGFHFSQMKWHFRFFYYRCSDDGEIPQSPCVIWQCCMECTGAYRCGSPQRPMKYACYHSAGLSDSMNDTAASFWKMNDISDWLRMNGVPGSVLLTITRRLSAILRTKPPERKVWVLFFSWNALWFMSLGSVLLLKQLKCQIVLSKSSTLSWNKKKKKKAFYNHGENKTKIKHIYTSESGKCSRLWGAKGWCFIR